MAQAAETQERSMEDQRGQLILTEVNNAVHSTFNALAQKQIILVDGTRSRTLEHLVGEMVRPMLKTWLDDNLPTLVECLVRTEIERISPPGERGECHGAP
jgi:cell pole-organizing protein PopZ